MKNNILFFGTILGISFLISIGIFSTIYTYDYCFNGGFCLSIDDDIIIPWVKEIEFFLRAITNPYTYIFGLIISPLIYLGANWWIES